MADRTKIVPGSELKDVIDSFPEGIEDNVYICGLNSAKLPGGKSYIVLHENGNWMINSPKYSPRLVEWLHSNGGLKYIFLTHRDAVGEEYEYAWEFGARRIMHSADLEAEPNAEIVVNEIEPRQFENDFVVIHTPGHTPGHCMLLYKNKYLFTGDVLTANARFGEGLEITDPFYCRGSWDTQTKSIERLRNFTFTRTLPAHGIAFSTNTSAEMSKQVDRVIEQCMTEADPDPSTPQRIEFFQRIADFAETSEQPGWASTMRERARGMQNRLTNVSL